MAIEIATAYVQIEPTTKGIKSSLTNQLGGAGSSAGQAAGKSFSSKFLKFATVTAVVAEITKGIKAALNEGAKMEQSIGGIETLFKDSAASVIANADNAWKTAGISANSYMEQATSFSASLLQSLGGDTEKAAKYADMAIVDMADNANKMGTSIESIQNAYQGFAKQNYTMLDNLKLGYGGTKTEMQRLLSDAEALTGKKYDLSNLADVYEAIHVIQEELDITGTTAEEAATTYSGSFASMKAAWSDLLGNLMLGRTELDDSVIALGKSMKTLIADNLLPDIATIVKSSFRVLGGEIRNFGPEVKSSLISVMGKVTEAAPSVIPQYIEKGKEVVLEFVKGIEENAPELVSAGWEMIKAIIKGIVESWPSLISLGAEIALAIGKAIIENIKNIPGGLAEIVVIIGNGLIEAIPELVKAGEELAQGLGETIQNQPWYQKGVGIMSEIGYGIAYMAGFTKQDVDTFVADIGEKFDTLKDTSHEKAGELKEKVVKKYSELKEKAIPIFQELKEKSESKFEAFAENCHTSAKTLRQNMHNRFNEIKFNAVNAMAYIKTNGPKRFDEFVEDITGKIEEAKRKIKNCLDKIEGFFEKLKLKIPEIQLPKLPHIRLTVTSKTILGKTFEYPSGFEFYAKAVDNPFLMTVPTMFAPGKIGGETEDELLYGHKSLMRDIEEASGSKTTDEILSYLVNGGLIGDIVEALGTMNVKFDERELARMVRKYA